jgi:hypothetical protein
MTSPKTNPIRRMASAISARYARDRTSSVPAGYLRGVSRRADPARIDEARHFA